MSETQSEGRVISKCIGDISAYVGGQLQGRANVRITGVQTLALAGPSELAFCSGAGYRAALLESQAGVVILSNELFRELGQAFHGNAIVVADPHLAYAKAASYLVPPVPIQAGIAPTAVVADEAEVSAQARLAPGTVLESGVVIEAGVVIGPNCVIGKNTKIGAGSQLGANVSVYANTAIGQQCDILAGAVIGSDGFGFARDSKGWLKVPQLGRAIIGDRVHIGANSCIDRGSIGDTIVADDVIIDNLVQIAHNVQIGQYTAVAGSAAIAGSTTIGANCLLAGRVAIVGHLQICDGVQINADSLVTKSITQPGIYAANWPAQPVRRWRRMLARLKSLPRK